ncbi:hypothetical protein [Listeria booriae]|uniref:Replication initiator protein A C-terminal domain-containing protein n=1 Tax=Listeria booriae TaxID=1552123 RepID=A0A842FGY0_9LIST|nr:hypothetical protein [Listeria booriae]MBC2242266.1 hypothetical protein [Listeria booriae]
MGLEILKDYSTFSDNKKLDTAVEQHILHNQLNDSAIRVLHYLAACAIRYDGACTVLRQSVATKLNLSVSTVARAYIQLRAINAISTKPTRRRNVRGGSGANIIQILPFETPDDTPDDTPVHGAESPQNQVIASDNINNENDVSYISSLKNTTLLDTYATPELSWRQNFIMARKNTGLTEKTLHFLTLFSHSAKEAGNLVGMLYRCKKEVSEQRQALLLLEDLDEAIFKTLRSVHSTCKVSNIKNVQNYLYMALLNLFHEKVNNQIENARSAHVERFGHLLNQATQGGENA